VAIAAAIVADSWIVPLPTFPLPPSPPIPLKAAGAAAFMELPLGGIEPDTAAMYRATVIDMPTLNGYSGNEPTHYDAVRAGLEDHDDSVLDALTARGPIAVAVRRAAAGAVARLQWLRLHPRATALSEDTDASWFIFRAVPPPPKAGCGESLLPLASARDRRGPLDLRALTDGDSMTFWMTPEHQQAGDTIEIDLGGVSTACSIRISLGTSTAFYPRRLTVATSSDGESWSTAFIGSMGGAAVLAALERPHDARLEIPLPESPARFIRLRLEEGHPRMPWIVTEVAVTAVGRK
jgi:hypothetical protein